MMPVITSLSAMEILDSRGNPALRVFCGLDNGVKVSASVPSGASIESILLRDGDKQRYNGKGVLAAVRNVNELIAPRILGLNPARQPLIDQLMVELDGTPGKSKLGTNTMLAVSMAVARAGAAATNLPLYTFLGGPGAVRLPVPQMNILNGGKIANNSLDFQEFMIMPLGAPSFAESLRYGAETFHALKKILARKGYATKLCDEGEFAPSMKSNEEACELIVEAIAAAGYEPGQDVAITLTPAASSFYGGGRYNLAKSGQGHKTSDEMIRLYRDLVEKYPIVSIKEGMAENNWDGFRALTVALGDKVQIVGDDMYITKAGFITRDIGEGSSNAILIKLNQIGTVSETITTIGLCRKAGWSYVISHCSGETEDAFIADFAVAMGGGQIKTGSACRGECIAKYNRLLEIEAELGQTAVFDNPFT